MKDRTPAVASSRDNLRFGFPTVTVPDIAITLSM
jgi:hypothetical protein